VFLALPNNTLREEAKAAIWDQAKFDVPMRIRPTRMMSRRPLAS